MTRRFERRVALVTGGGGGVGAATALLLAGEGASVALVGRRMEPLREVAGRIEQAGSKVLCIAADVSVEEQISAAVQQARRAFGRFDLLVNAAGILRVGTAPSQPVAEWDAMFDTNAKGCFLASRAAIAAMGPGGGAIVNVSSVFALAASKGASVYAASKAAVVALTRTMALDHIGDGIRINGVAPGSMATPMLREVSDKVAPDDPTAMLDDIGRLHPIGRLIDAEEVARLIAFLLSDDAGAVVGATYVIDGGRLASLGSAG